MGSTGRASASGGSPAPAQESSNKYDYSTGTAEEAAARLTAATGTVVSDNVLRSVNRENLSGVLEAIHRVYDAEGVAPESVRLTNRAIAATDGTNLFLNPAYYAGSAESLAQVGQDNFNTGFHPSADPRNFIEHEMGHILTNNFIGRAVGAQTIGKTGVLRGADIMQRYNKSLHWNNSGSWAKESNVKNLVKDAIKNVGIKVGMKAAARTISGYAARDPAECVAEAYADVRANGNSAKALSKEIVRLLKL